MQSSCMVSIKTLPVGISKKTKLVQSSSTTVIDGKAPLTMAKVAAPRKTKPFIQELGAKF
jgi:hypothetical protein